MPKRGSKVYSYVVVDDNANLDKLNTIDKLRANYASWQKDTGRDELRKAKNEEALLEGELSLRADLLGFIEKATAPIREGREKNVVLDLDKIFDFILDDILESDAIKPFYTPIILDRPKPEFEAIDYVIRIKLVAK